MSNYPNMSYCMFENTLAAMRQVLSNMDEQDVHMLREMSRTERRAFEELFHACETFLSMSDDLLECEESEQDFEEEATL